MIAINWITMRLVGKHPKYDNVYMASGFTGRGLMQAPGVGRALDRINNYWLLSNNRYKCIFSRKST